MLLAGLLFPFLSRSAPAEFIGWEADEEEFDEQYYLPRFRFRDSSGKEREFVSSEGIYHAGPPLWDNRRTPQARYLTILPACVETLNKNPFFEMGRGLILSGAFAAPVLAILQMVKVKD